MRLAEIMSRDPVAVTEDWSVQEVARLMQEEDIGMVPVITSEEERKLVGVVTDRDIAIRVVATGLDASQTKVGQVMTQGKLVCCEEETHLDKAMHLMSHEQIRRLPITDKWGYLVGIVAQADLALHAEARKTAETVGRISEPGGRHQH